MRAKLDRDARELLERVREEQDLALGVDRGALRALCIPSMPDLETSVRRIDVEITRAADDLAARGLAHDKRHRAVLLAHVERRRDVLTHPLGGGDRRVPEPP